MNTRTLISADLLVLTDPRGAVLGVSGGDAEPIRRLGERAKPLDEISTFIAHSRGLLEAISVPVVVLDDDPPLRLRAAERRLLHGRSSGRAIQGADRQLRSRSPRRAESSSSSLPRETRDALVAVLNTPGISSLMLGDEEYLALARPILHEGREQPPAPRLGEGDVPVTLVLQSRTARLSVLNSLRLGLAGALIITILLATILSYFVARTVTRPLAAVTGAMGDLAVTGDLTRKVPVRSRAWDDEDARLLASAFNSLTESIARFQKEAAQKERLSSLGRLSTVIAHEIRNPLMIIRATLTSLRRDHVNAADRLEAAADIDEETTRAEQPGLGRPRFRQADSLPSRAGQPERRLPGVGGRGLGRTRGRGSGTGPRSGHADRGHRRRTAAHGAREHPDQCPPRDPREHRRAARFGEAGRTRLVTKAMSPWPASLVLSSGPDTRLDA